MVINGTGRKQAQNDFNRQSKVWKVHNMESIRITRRKEIRKIRRGGKSNKIFFRGNRDGRWEHIWGIEDSFMQAGSITKGNRR